MSKTPIGFFKEPLSQEEVDYIHEQLQQGWIDQYWHSVYQGLNKAMQAVCDRFNGAHISNDRFSAYLNEPFNEWLRIRAMQRELKPYEKYSFQLDFSDDIPGYYSIEYSSPIIQMRDGGYNHYTARAFAGHTQASLVDKINRHLVQNPELRVVPPHRQKVEDLNNELMGILRSRGYQSETGNGLPDFSDFIAKLIK